MRMLLTAAEMRSLDREAIEDRGIPGYQLMERAGIGVAEVILEYFADLEDARVIVLAGPGNNGGDGFVAARHLKKAGVRPRVLLVGLSPEALKGDAAQAYASWRDAGGKTRGVVDTGAWSKQRADLDEAEVVIDALLGTGSRGAPRGLIGEVVESLEGIEVPIVAVDIPTGLDADTGHVEGACVHADLTATMAYPKRGHVFFPGRAFVGDLEWVDIGLPADLSDPRDGFHAYLVEPEDAADRLPERDPEMHKGDRGSLLVVGGSPGLTGALALAAEAAVRAGAGLVTAGVPLSLADVVETKLTEAMTLPLPELEARALSRDAFDAIALFQPGRLTALALGPGLRRHPSTQALVRRVVEEIDLPTVVDADGLHAFAGEPDRLWSSACGRRLVLTPHAGEFIALTGESPEALAGNRLEIVARWASRLDSVVVLKGAPTVIADPDTESLYVNPTGSEALATGGTGDVLTGFIAGFLAQGLDPLDAALAGVYFHGWTADALVEEWGSLYGLKAGDLIDFFPVALGLFLSPPLEVNE